MCSETLHFAPAMKENSVHWTYGDWQRTSPVADCISEISEGQEWVCVHIKQTKATCTVANQKKRWNRSWSHLYHVVWMVKYNSAATVTFRGRTNTPGIAWRGDCVFRDRRRYQSTHPASCLFSSWLLGTWLLIDKVLRLVTWSTQELMIAIKVQDCIMFCTCKNVI